MPFPALFRRGPKPSAHRYVDMWAFMGVHPTNIDLLRRLKMADDRQFSANMDVCGTVSQRDLKSGAWSQSHIVGIRTDAWQPRAEQQQKLLERILEERREFLKKTVRPSGTLTAAQMKRLQNLLLKDAVMRMHPRDLESRRLVMKLFSSTSSRIRWEGTLEEMTTREVHHSMGSQRTLLAFVATMQGNQYITQLHENHRTFRIPSIFTFSYLDELRGRMWYINIKRKWVSVGADFVVESEGRQIGLIDGALIGFGYNAHVYVYEQELAKDTEFVDLLTLFATSVGYHRAMRRAIRRRIKATMKGLTGQNIVEPEEIRLLRNPRFVA